MISTATEPHLADYADFHKSYPSLVPHLPAKIAPAPRNYALEERVAEIKAEIIAETPYLWCERDRHHHEDILEHLQYHGPLNERLQTLLRAAVRQAVSIEALGLCFRELVADAIGHQAELDLEKAADEEADDDADVRQNWR